jgi:hypothetical protein
MTEYEKILSTEYSETFDKIRKDAMVMSHYKYGFIKENAQKKAVHYIETLEKRLQKYKDTGNAEFLADVANFAMIEFMYPQHPNGHYKPTDSKESPGLVGMSTKEIEDFKDNNVE